MHSYSYLLFFNSLLFAQILTAASSQFLQQNANQQTQCTFISDFTTYDLMSLSNPNKDYQVTDPLSSDVYVFNFCKYTSNPCNQTVSTYAYRYSSATNATSINQNSSKCNLLTNNSIPTTIQSVVQDYQEENGKVKTKQLLHFTQTGGEECNGQPSLVTFNIICDPNGSEYLPSEKDILVNSSVKCHPQITLTHKSGCATIQISASGWRHDPIEEVRTLYASNYQLYLLQQVVAFILGMYLLFLGEKRANEIIGLGFGYSGFIISMAYFWNLTTLGNLSYLFAIFIGIMIGFFAYKNLAHLFISALGGFAGLLLALIVISIFAVENDLYVYSILIIGFLLGFMGYFVGHAVQTTCCVITGAYLMVEGATTFLGGLPSFLLGIQDLFHGGKNYFVPTMFYILVFIGTIFFGLHYRRKH